MAHAKPPLIANSNMESGSGTGDVLRWPTRSIKRRARLVVDLNIERTRRGGAVRPVVNVTVSVCPPGSVKENNSATATLQQAVGGAADVQPCCCRPKSCWRSCQKPDLLPASPSGRSIHWELFRPLRPKRSRDPQTGCYSMGTDRPQRS